MVIHVQVAVVITDGGSDDKKRTIEEAHKLKMTGVHVIVVQVGTWVDQYELNGKNGKVKGKL